MTELRQKQIRSLPAAAGKLGMTMNAWSALWAAKAPRSESEHGAPAGRMTQKRKRDSGVARPDECNRALQRQRRGRSPSCLRINNQRPYEDKNEKQVLRFAPCAKATQGKQDGPPVKWEKKWSVRSRQWSVVRRGRGKPRPYEKSDARARREGWATRPILKREHMGGATVKAPRSKSEHGAPENAPPAK